jgi:hypothetical protein
METRQRQDDRRADEEGSRRSAQERQGQGAPQRQERDRQGGCGAARRARRRRDGLEERQETEPRRYSEVTNKVATTMSTMRPGIPPTRMLVPTSPLKMAPPTRGAMSPEPVIVTALRDSLCQLDAVERTG